MATTSILFDDQIEIPVNLDSLAAFRAWATADDAPESGRFDYINGRIEVDMSPEDLFTHGTIKGDIHVTLHRLVRAAKLGHVFLDSARISSPAANLSAEPDLLFISTAALETNRVRLVPKSNKPDRFVEIEGAPDLVVEIVSDSSVTKDTKRLPVAYFQAGVLEYWLVDARSEELRFEIHTRGDSAFEVVATDADGFQVSPVLSHRLKLTRERDASGLWSYELLDRPLG